jgi:uncharacterized membrane protein YuzA (DUF378 family)
MFGTDPVKEDRTTHIVYGLVGLGAVYGITQRAIREPSTSTGGARSASTQA